MSKATMNAEADTLEREAEILKRGQFATPGPTQAVSQLEQALEILLRKRDAAMGGIFREEAPA